MQVRLATFNAHHGEGLDGRLDVARIARVVTALDASVVALQELDRGMERSGRDEQPALIASATGMHVVFHATLSRDGEYGIALACRDDVQVAVHELPRLGREEPRAALSTRWNGFTIIGTHLSRDARARAAQTTALAELSRSLPPPVVLMGDLNQGRSGLGPLIDAGLAPSRRRNRTLASRWRSGELDHVLAGRGARVVSSRAVRTKASDHRPVVAVVRRSAGAARSGRGAAG